MDHHDDPTPDDRERELALRGASLVEAAVAEVRAPLELRERIETQRVRTAPHRRRRHLALFGSAATVLGAVLVFLFFSLPSDTPLAPTIVEAAKLSELPATLPAPGASDVNPKLLRRVHDGVAYPYWEDRFEWRASGARTDRLRGRDATTVFYTSPTGVRMGYTILSGKRIEPPKEARNVEREGTQLYYFYRGARTILTWERNGRTCVISAPKTVETNKLLELAAWKGGKGGVPF